MTTNLPEKLDPALVRPGRVDYKLGFTFADEIQVEELFRRAYSHKNVDDIAKEFTSKIPVKKFSPAAIQGFFLQMEDDPNEAVEKVGKWVDDNLQGNA
jgi:chaperone BCS1